MRADHTGSVWHRLEARKVRRWFARRPPTFAGPAPQPDLPVGTDTLPQISHIVILMMENHSFDNYLGTLGRGDGIPQADGAPPAGLRHFEGTVQGHGVPTQSWNGAHIQFNGGANDGFARSIEVTVPKGDPTAAMGYWTDADLPFYHGLANTFPLADRWFCSCLGPTFPNRRFLVAGTAHGLIDDLPFAMVDYPPAGTIFDHLTTQGISWANYHRVSKTKVVFKRALGVGPLRWARLLALVTLKWLPPVLKAFEGNMQLTADLYPIGMARSIAHLRSTDQLWADLDSGHLAAVSIVDPDFSGYSEENPQDIRRGESFAAEVVNRVMRSPAWPNTLLIWLYDEHGGYYDHVPPPPAVRPDDIDGRGVLSMPRLLVRLFGRLLPKQVAEIEAIDTGPKRYDRLGFRVPAVIVSPYARPDFVTHQVYDHTSVLKLIERKWNLPPLTQRDLAANDPIEALDFDAPPAFAIPPSLPAPALVWGNW